MKSDRSLPSPVLVLATLAALLFLISIVSPWYGWRGYTFETEDGEMTYESVDSLGFSLYNLDSCSLYCASGEVGAVFGIVFFITIISLLSTCSIIAVALFFNTGHFRGYKTLVMLLGISIVLSVSAPVVMMFFLPNALKSTFDEEGEGTYDDLVGNDGDDSSKSFFGKYSKKETIIDGERTEELRWGPDFGWFLPFASAVLLVACTVLLVLNRKRYISNIGLEDIDVKEAEYLGSFSEGNDNKQPKDQDEEEELERRLYERLKKKYDRCPEKKDDEISEKKNDTRNRIGSRRKGRTKSSTSKRMQDKQILEEDVIWGDDQ